MEYWALRLERRKIAYDTAMRFGEPVLIFSDPDGLPLELIGVTDAAEVYPWADSSLPAEHFIHGFHSATAILNSLQRTEGLLTGVLGFEKVAVEADRTRFKMADSRMPGYHYDIIKGGFGSLTQCH